MNKAIVGKASAAGQNHGAIVRAAAVNGAMAVRDTVANTVVPGAKTGAHAVATVAKSALAYGVGFVRNLAGK